MAVPVAASELTQGSAMDCHPHPLPVAGWRKVENPKLQVKHDFGEHHIRSYGESMNWGRIHAYIDTYIFIPNQRSYAY